MLNNYNKLQLENICEFFKNNTLKTLNLTKVNSHNELELKLIE